ncbi:multicopper oxidase domain-containing protein [Sphaerisporangium perillae]|uniref:multicopper oxidase domain-containing protein n=1 Tax=Sphaerisporangium perillae TaxID=2935860 RepID=UPI00200F528E|nr:multicopper oxidase domain-containing protein [Sphaerisporangium perillae]
MVTRRQFLQAGAAAALAARQTRGPRRRAVADGLMDPREIAKYAIPLAVPAVMLAVPSQNGATDRYVIGVRRFRQQILPPGRPATPVWGYGSPMNPETFATPARTLEAVADRPTRVTWVNELVDADGGYLPHLLPADPTLHWANPPGGPDGRDGRPTFSATPGAYRGPVPIVTHLHGGHSSDDSDGHPEAWFLPRAAGDIPGGYAAEGSRYAGSAAAFESRHGVRWGTGSAVYQYANDQRAATLWYHDHTLGITRLNVYAGLAGFYLVRGGASDLSPGILPGPAPQAGDPPASPTVRSPSSSRTGRSPRTARCSTPAAAASPTGSAARTSRAATSRPSGYRSSTAPRSWSTAAPGPICGSSRAVTGSGCSTGATPASSSCRS